MNVTLDKIRVIYEDNHLIAVNKLPGELAQGDKTNDETLVDLVKDYIKVKYNKPGAVFLGVIHRLDRPVSGVIVFARTSKALGRMNKLFKENQVEKTYCAIVERIDLTGGSLRHWLGRLPGKNITRAYDKPVKDAKEAILDYRPMRVVDNYTLLEVKPQTGRQHQIRVQLSAIGAPIVGDLKYGYPKPNPDKSICLHAQMLSFIHPVRKEPVELTAERPEIFPWSLFS